MIRIILADDQKLFRETLKYLLEQDDELKVVGCAANGKEALQLCREQTPDVVLMDLAMPVCDGVEGTARIKKECREVKVLVLTTFGSDENVSRALKNGADGYVLKEIDSRELILAIKSVAGGLGIMQRNILESVANRMDGDKSEAVKMDEELFGLSERDIDIIRMIAEGKTNREIAEQLYLAEGSVKNIISGILGKLKLKDRIGLVVFALKNGLL